VVKHTLKRTSIRNLIFKKTKIVKMISKQQMFSVTFALYGCLGSISSMFYYQLWREQIPKAQKRLTTWLYFFALSWSPCVKAACKMLMKLTPDHNKQTTAQHCLWPCHIGVLPSWKIDAQLQSKIICKSCFL